MTAKRILFTGGSGKAGKHVVAYLLEQGHQVDFCFVGFVLFIT